MGKQKLKWSGKLGCVTEAKQKSWDSAKSTPFPSQYTIPLSRNKYFSDCGRERRWILDLPNHTCSPRDSPEWWQITVLTLPMVAHTWSQLRHARAHTHQKIKQWSRREHQKIKPAVLKLQHASEPPGEFAETQISGPLPRDSDLVGLGRAWGFAFLMSSQVMLTVLVQGPHLENHRVRLCLRTVSETASPLEEIHLVHTKC